MTGPSRSLVVVSAGLGHPSSTRLLADRLTAAVERHLRDAGIEPDVQVVELRDHAQDLTIHLLSGFPSPKLQAALDAVLGADGLIAVSPIFSASFSGLFKLFFDALDEGAMKGRPVLLGATGGTARHSLVVDHAMLPLFFYLKAIVDPHPVFAATKDWGTAGGKLEKRIARAATSFAKLVRAATPAKGGDELEVTDFTDLLMPPLGSGCSVHRPAYREVVAHELGMLRLRLRAFPERESTRTIFTEE